jgi:nicotinate-nucleotide adenylyltransferase
VEQNQRNPRLKSEDVGLGLDPICIFGGAFDPIHVGHLLVAEDVAAIKRAARVLFIPCNAPPTKEKTAASAEERLDMVRLAVKGNPMFDVSDTEVKRGGISYTVDTLRELRSSYGAERELCLLVGMDQLNVIEGWRDPGEIVKMARILVVGRPGYEESGIPAELTAKVEIVNSRQIEVSSTEIRNRLRKGKPVRYMVTEPVLEYIYEHSLYGAGSGSAG